jgi:oligopeptide/dipeptide ABC transporter ATP-binding protein
MDTDREQPLAVIPGRPPEPDAMPEGCAFAARCSSASDRCRDENPDLALAGPGHRVACWHPAGATMEATGGAA